MKNGKPVIALTGSYEQTEETERVFLNYEYFHAIRSFGGIPLLIPTKGTEEEYAWLLDQCDGLLLTGGNDLDPALFGETVWNDTVKIAVERDQSEWILCRLAVERELPILGICRGIQVMNVYFGGSLYQDLPTQYPTEVAHSMEKPYNRTAHDCLLEPNSPLRNLLQQETIAVNSHHHQAVKAAAPGFQVMGRCSDGVIEAVWDPSVSFRWGIQWHPERIWDQEESSARVFEAFLSACKRNS